MNMIVIESLTRCFNDVTAVNELSFNVREGELFGFLGPNGSGKTTTIKMLCTLLLPTRGNARVNGYDIREQAAQVRSSIGILFQDPSLDLRLTGYENLDFFAALYFSQAKAGRRKERIDEVLRLVNLGEVGHRLVGTYSWGMRRRLEVARSLIPDPRVLFLDEPTTGLDLTTRRHIWNHLDSVRRQYNTTMFLATHDMDEAENCHRVAVIDHGRLLALDTPRGLKTQYGGPEKLRIKCTDPKTALTMLNSMPGLQLHQEADTIELETEDAAGLLTRLNARLGSNLVETEIIPRTMTKVFLSLAGEAIRPEAGDPRDMVRRRHRDAHWRVRG